VFDWDNDTSDFAATDAAFARAAHVTTLEIVNNRIVVNSMEPRNAIGDWDAVAERPVLYSGTQGSHFVRDPLAEVVLKIPKEKLRVVTPPNVGGGFGMKAFVYPEQALVVWAAGKLKRPVHWQSDRSEAFISDNQGRDHFTRAELAIDAKGNSLDSVSHSSPMSEPICRQWARLFPRARLISFRASTQLPPSRSTSKACAPTPCQCALIAVPAGPKHLI